MPDFPHMLTGRDLLQKLRAAVSFGENSASLTVDSGQVLPTFWSPVLCLRRTSYLTQPWRKEHPSGYTQELKVFCCLGRRNPQGLAAHWIPVVIQLLKCAAPVGVKQYPWARRPSMEHSLAPVLTHKR